MNNFEKYLVQTLLEVKRTPPARSKEEKASNRRIRDRGRVGRSKDDMWSRVYEPPVASVHGKLIRRYLAAKSETVPSQDAIKRFKKEYGRMPGHRVP